MYSEHVNVWPSLHNVTTQPVYSHNVVYGLYIDISYRQYATPILYYSIENIVIATTIKKPKFCIVYAVLVLKYLII